MQASLLPVMVQFESDARQFGHDGQDLKYIARGDDGRDYAVKGLDGGVALPICEWVGYHLWRDCGLLTPECAILHFRDGRPPAFGSRIEMQATQMSTSANHYTLAGFFGPHKAKIAAIYPLDAFYTNPDRHGRNFLERFTVTGSELLSIDFSRAWLQVGGPFGNEAALTGSNTEQWWSVFREFFKINKSTECTQAALALSPDWLDSVIKLAPAEWSSAIDASAACLFWRQFRAKRIAFAETWTS